MKSILNVSWLMRSDWPDASRTRTPVCKGFFVAEGEGFEPPVALTPLRFSSPSPATPGGDRVRPQCFQNGRPHTGSVRRSSDLTAPYGVT
jgi:hypothetical protein